MTEEKNNKLIEKMTANASEHKHISLWKNPSFRHIAALMAACSVFYYMDVIIDYAGWANLRLHIFYTVHDLHRAFFLIPVMYAAYAFRIKGVAVTGLISFLIFLPRALFVSPFPDPLLRPIIFTVSMSIIGVFLSLLLNNIKKRVELQQDLSNAQNDLLRRQTEEALRESEDKYKSLIDNVPDIIFTIDLEGKITFVSKRTKEILGYENAETININIFNFIPEEDRQRAIENLQKGMKGVKIKHFQIPLIAKSGEMLFFECSFARIYKDGAVIGAQGTAVDITERKKAEEALRASEEKLQMALSGSAIGLWDLDIATMSGTIDERAAQILDYNKDEIPNQLKFWDEMTHPDDVPQIRESLRAHLEGRIPFFETEHRMRKKTGEWKWVRGMGKITKRHIDGSPILISGTVYDITERKLAEEKIKTLNTELEQRVAQRTAELTAKTVELERTNKVFVDRELRMRELKERIAELEKQKT